MEPRVEGLGAGGPKRRWAAILIYMSERDRTRTQCLQLLALSFVTLFLELMIIRWVPAGVRLVAYYANLMLISSFLGIGLGALLQNRGTRLFSLFPYLLAIDLAVLVIARQLTLPTFGAEHRYYAVDPDILNLSVLVAIFALNVLLFVPLGERIGALFDSLPRLRAYAWDIAGSLLGTLAFGVFSFLFFAPIFGFALVAGIYLGLAEKHMRWPSALAFGVCLVLVGMSSLPGAIWSPYHYVTVQDIQSQAPVVIDEVPREVREGPDPPAFSVSVNRDYYQLLQTMDPTRYSPGSPARQHANRTLANASVLYRLLGSPDRVLVVGAGGGKDVEAALLNGAGRVDAVEIDPVLVELSRRLSASGVYYDPRVHVVNDDARAFFSRAEPVYDAVVFGHLDSQALFSSMNNIRLDGFVYTVESFRAAFRLVREGGVLALGFQAPRQWLQDKLVAMMAEATGHEPIVYEHAGTLAILVPRGELERVPETYGTLKRVSWVPPASDTTPLATDDWPFLYLSERSIPNDYLVVIVTLLALSSIALFVGMGPLRLGAEQVHFAALGAGFLLLQTKSITDCSLYFGATWLVTTLVVAGILVMVFAANLVAMRIASVRLSFYIPLLCVLFVLWWVPNDLVLEWPVWGRLAWVLVVVPLPVFFAGLIFSTTFRDASAASPSFGANLLGSAVGGFAEYGGMAMGYQGLGLVVIAVYLLSFVVVARTGLRGQWVS
ncbi:hypothetical protein MK489_18150 [Myxococcota bacterium]|nr:hypothetical protein [Myxococcota bacterium]